MTVAQHTSSESFEQYGEIELVSTLDLHERLQRAEEAGFLAVAVPAPGPADRGRLALVIEEAIESSLQKRGGCAPGIGAATDLDSSLSDQLYRARLIEQRGLALGLPALDGIATLGGTLDSEDSAVLRWWLRATTERPVSIYLDACNRYLGVYGRPAPLHELVARASGVGTRSEPPPLVAPEVASSMASADLASSDENPEVEAGPRAPRSPEPASDVVAELLAELLDRHSEERAEISGPERTPETESIDSIESAESPQASLQSAAENNDATPLAGQVLPSEASEPADEQATVSPVANEAAPKAEPLLISEAEPAEAPLPPPLRPAHGPLNQLASELWPQWLRDLEAARGPKPLAAVERMFVSSYVPLRDAVTRGIAQPSATAALETWAQSFAQSYKEAFTALCVRGKRPTMVVDVPDLALRIARLHGARSVQLVLVDGMRFDLGLRIEQQLRALLGQEVALTERLLLWSALPASTAVQLELLGRGPDALRDWSGTAESEVPVARGRNAATPRRVKAGHRELLKLDIVEARLSEPGADEATRLDALADETADALAAYIGRLPARTLVMVFGDHGFVLDPMEGGTAAARQGGTRPEEVLVPGFAWLIGGLH